MAARRSGFQSAFSVWPRVPSMSRSVHGRSLNEKLSSLVLLPLGQRHPHIKTAVLTYGVKWPSGSRAGCSPGSPARAVPTSPYVHVCLMQISLPTTVSMFFLCCPFFFLFLFLTDFPLTSPPVSVRCREGVLRGCEEATGLPAWPPACDRHPRQARRAQSPTGEEEGRDRRLRSDLWSAELAARSVPSAVAQLASSGCPSLNRGITGLELGN